MPCRRSGVCTASRPRPPAGSVATVKTLHLLRHATTEDALPGRPDADRRLTEQGWQEARALGEHLRAAGVRPDEVWCSSATRARQTCSALDLDVEPQQGPALYRTHADGLLEMVAGCDPATGSLLVVGHNPAMQDAAWELVTPGTAEQELLGRRFPPATFVTLTFDGPWSGLTRAVCTEVRLP